MNGDKWRVMSGSKRRVMNGDKRRVMSVRTRPTDVIPEVNP